MTVDTKTFAALSADGQTASFELPGDVCDVDVYIDDADDFGTGTLKPQVSPDGGTTWIDVPGESWTSGSGFLGQIKAYGRDIRFDLAGATSPDITVQIVAKARSQAEIKRVTLTADGNEVVTLPRGFAEYAVFSYGDFGTGTAKVEESPDGGTTYYDTSVSDTADALTVVTNTAANHNLRVDLSGATSPSLTVDIYAAL